MDVQGCVLHYVFLSFLIAEVVCSVVDEYNITLKSVACNRNCLNPLLEGKQCFSSIILNDVDLSSQRDGIDIVTIDILTGNYTQMHVDWSIGPNSSLKMLNEFFLKIPKGTLIFIVLQNICPHSSTELQKMLETSNIHIGMGETEGYYSTAIIAGCKQTCSAKVTNFTPFSFFTSNKKSKRTISVKMSQIVELESMIEEKGTSDIGYLLGGIIACTFFVCFLVILYVSCTHEKAKAQECQPSPSVCFGQNEKEMLADPAEDGNEIKQRKTMKGVEFRIPIETKDENSIRDNAEDVEALYLDVAHRPFCIPDKSELYLDQPCLSPRPPSPRHCEAVRDYNKCDCTFRSGRTQTFPLESLCSLTRDIGL